MDRLRLLGQEVRVYKNGIVWIDPDTKQHFMIGKTRAEALEALKEWREKRAGAFAERFKTRALPRIEPDTKVPRAYWKALYNARTRARRSKSPIMTTEEYLEIVKRSNGCCEVTGIAFSDHRPKGSRVAPWAPSLDRISCAAGYEASNTRLVCIAVNMALHEFGVEVLTRIAFALERRSVPAENIEGAG